MPCFRRCGKNHPFENKELTVWCCSAKGTYDGREEGRSFGVGERESSMVFSICLQTGALDLIPSTTVPLQSNARGEPLVLSQE